MSGGELSNIGRIAEIIAADLFSFYKWEQAGPANLNFQCVKKEMHSKAKHGEHHHPVDIVLKYFDPYLNKTVYLLVDLKSYAKGSIDSTAVKKALVSLGKSIDCARVSPEWRDRYVYQKTERREVRGMLFVFNHDDLYDRDFYDHFKDLSSASLHIGDGQQVHIIEPALINYICTVKADINELVATGKFPKRDYTFYYPDMVIHKASGEYWSRAATVEMIASPYLIIHHKEVVEYGAGGSSFVTFDEGYIVYYRRQGSTEYEFMYLFDALSRFQILNSNKNYKIRIRVANRDVSDKLYSNFKSAIASYVRDWNEDEHRRKILESIELSVVNTAVPNYKQEHVGWEYR